MQKLGLRSRWMPALVCIALAGTAHADPADKPLETLLRKVEQQVASGHAMAPFVDNAMETWQTVLVLVQREHLSPGTGAALGDFAARLRKRAATERTVQPILASDFTVFADQATRLLSLVPPREIVEPPVLIPEPKPVPVTKDAPAPISPIDRAPEPTNPVPVALTPPHPTVTPPASLPNVTVPVALTPPPPAPIVKPVEVAIAAPAAIAMPMAKPVFDSTQGLMFAKRGDEMLEVKDISAARKFYEAAANAGNVHAAVILAKSYDPFFVEDFKTMVFRPDPDMAVFWYRKAAALGDPEAATRLNSLTRK